MLYLIRIMGKLSIFQDKYVVTEAIIESSLIWCYGIFPIDGRPFDVELQSCEISSQTEGHKIWLRFPQITCIYIRQIKDDSQSCLCLVVQIFEDGRNFCEVIQWAIWKERNENSDGWPRCRRKNYYLV